MEFIDIYVPEKTQSCFIFISFPINNEKRKVLKIATVLNSEWLYLVLEKHSHCF